MKKKPFVTALMIWLLLVGFFHSTKEIPEGLNLTGEAHTISADDAHFFADTTYLNERGERVSEQTIFDEVLRMIDEAQQYVLIDFFFYSDFIGTETTAYRELSKELTDALIAKKQVQPDIVIQVITDPINVIYGGYRSANFNRLEAAGIPVIVTELLPLRDSNPLYSSVWRTFFQWFGTSDRWGYLPNALDAHSSKLGLRTYLKIPNYKANHRKVALTDYRVGDTVGFSTLVTSANPHDGSSAHSNSAVRIDTAIWKDILQSETAAAALGDYALALPPEVLINDAYQSEGNLIIQVLTEKAIKERIITELNGTAAGDRIDLAMFYIADRDIVAALKAADKRGVILRLLFDPNKDAFGREKNGVPNRQVAHELMQSSDGTTTIRWCNTHGEQCHSKLLLITKGDEKIIIQGSANYTRRNLDNYNLETDVVITGPAKETVFTDAQQFFDRQWSNEAGREYSVAYQVYEDTSLWRQLSYRFKEFSGLSHW